MKATRMNAALPSSCGGGRREPKEANQSNDQESQGTKLQQQQQKQEERVNGVDEASRVESGPSDRSGNEQPPGDLDGELVCLAPEVSAPKHKTLKRKQQTNRTSNGGGGESGGGESNRTEGEGGGDRVSMGRWVVTMMVPGRKLWDSSPAMMSQYKRFRRSRQDPKIARDQVCGTAYNLQVPPLFR